MKTYRGKINIYKEEKRPNVRKIHTRSDWFDTERVKVNVEDGFLIFSKPSIDYLGVDYKISRLSYNRKYISATNDKIPIGEFEIDEEESNEDELIIYL